MANTLLTPSVIARRATMLLRANLVSARTFSRSYQPEFTSTLKVGSSVNVRRRGSGTVREWGGSSITVDNIVETAIPITIEKHYDLSIPISSVDWTLNLQDFDSQVLQPNVLKVAEQIDSYAVSKFKHAPNPGGPSASAPAALPTSVADWANMDKTANDLKMPSLGRVAALSTEAKAAILSTDSWTEVDKSGTTDALRRAMVTQLMSFDGYMSQQIDTTTHTSGSMTTAAVNAGSGVAKGSTSIPFDTASGATATILANDLIFIAGYGWAVVAADVTAVSSAGTITIQEPLRADVANNAVITIYDGGGNTRQNHGAIYVPDAFQLVVVPPEAPRSANESGVYVDEVSGFGMRYVLDYDNQAKRDVLSLDVMVGCKMLDGRLCAQIIKNI